MAEILPNQPIIFDESLDCHLIDSGINVLAEYGDITQFQMELTPCISDFPLIQNSNFDDSSNWTLGPSWSIANGQACHSVGVYGTLSQVAPVSNGTLVRLIIDIDVTALGCVVVYGTYIENFSESGRYTRYIVASGASSIAVAASGSGAVCVNSLSAVTINTNFEVYITNDSGTVVDTLETSDGYFNFEDGYFTASIDWETLAISSGCYTLGVFDPCPCSQGGIIALDFVSALHNWSLASSWTIVGGIATYDGSSTGQAILNHVLCNGTEYDVTYTISGMAGNEEFNVRLGNENGTTRTVDGTYTDTITASGTSFIMIGNSTSGTQDFRVTDMSIEIATKTATYTSNTIKLTETTFGCKTYSIALCNDSDGLGFGFLNTGFRPNFRMDCSLVRGNYPMVRESYDYSNGVKSTTYGRMRVARELGMDVPPHLVDFMALSLLADHFYIDTDEYFVEDEEFPSVSWDDNSHLGAFSLNVSKKQQQIENRRLSSSSVGCVIDGSDILDDKFEKVTDETGAVITDG